MCMEGRKNDMYGGVHTVNDWTSLVNQNHTDKPTHEEGGMQGRKGENEDKERINKLTTKEVVMRAGE